MNTQTPAAEAAQAAHREAWNRIPWIVAGSASPAEKAAFEAHAAGCEDCRDELVLQRRLRATMHATALPAHGAEPALARLQVRIDIASSAEPLPQPPGRRSAGWTRAWAALALLQSAALVLLLAYGNRGAPGAGAGEYRTLTTPAPAVAALAATLRVVPAPALTAGDWRGLLKRHALVVVEASPDATAFGLARQGGAAPDAALLAALRAEPLLVMVEPLPGAPR
jgi:hypothetical protein